MRYGIAGLSATVGVAGVAGAAPNEGERGPPDKAANANILDQTVASDETTISVKQAFLPDGGFVVIHDERLFQGEPFESVIGKSELLEPGNHVNVDTTLDVSADEIGDYDSDGETTLIAMPHFDTNNNGEYDFVDTEVSRTDHTRGTATP